MRTNDVLFFDYFPHIYFLCIYVEWPKSTGNGRKWPVRSICESAPIKRQRVEEVSRCQDELGMNKQRHRVLTAVVFLLLQDTSAT